MNCRQARALLAIYRELKRNQTTMYTLESHLSHCAACKAVQEQYALMGEQLQALPSIDLLPDARTKLLQALAVEHVRMLQQSSASTATIPTPAFLTPYLKDLAQNAPSTNKLAAFATADTGPIPMLQRSMKRRSIHHINHFTIIGVAASFLVMLLVGGLTSLLLLTQHGSSITPPSLVVHQLNDVRSVNYFTTPVYPHVASAVASGSTIYYTTYNDDATNWQLEQFDEKANSTTALLAKPSSQELIVLGSSANWLIWLQIDLPKLTTTPTSQSTNESSIASARTWSLHAHYLGTMLSAGTGIMPFDQELIHNTFDPSSVPSWVHRPIQGICFIQNTLLAAIIDAQGTSHLQSFQLSAMKATPPSDLVHAHHGHLLAFPTANSDGTAIYWADEYMANASSQISSDIWTQQISNDSASPTPTDQQRPQQTIKQYAFRADGKSFHPQMVHDTLFLLNTNPTNSIVPTTVADPTASGTAAAQPFTTPLASPVAPTVVTSPTQPEGTINIDPQIFTPQIDSKQAGRILSFTAHGVPEFLPQFDTTQMVTQLQGGTSFLLWQNTDGSSFGMYDVIAKAPVEIGDNVFPPNTAFPTVNGDTALSVINQQNSINQQVQANPTVTFDTFRWPMPRS